MIKLVQQTLLPLTAALPRATGNVPPASRRVKAWRPQRSLGSGATFVVSESKPGRMPGTRWGRSATTATLACLVLWLGLGFAHAANLTVLNTDDSGAGSLRQAIADAASGDTIAFDNTLTGSTIALSGQLVINKNLTILGPGATNLAISGSGVGRVFYFNPGITNLLAGLTIRNGLVNANVSSERHGAGIHNNGTLAVSNCTIGWNVVIDEVNGLGGGIYNAAGAVLRIQGSLITSNSISESSFGGGLVNEGTTTILDSTISDNVAALGSVGGGIFNRDGVLTAQNCTFTGNYGDVSGGAIVEGYTNTTTIRNCTVIGNRSRAFTSGGINGGEGSIILENSIVAGNFTANVPSDVYGTVLGHGHNFIGLTNGISSGVQSTDKTFASTGTVLSDLVDIISADVPWLKNNGGPTPTVALLPGSPALNAGDPTFLPPPDFDQRGAGFPRVVAGRLDIGAFEFSTPPSITCPANIFVSVANGIDIVVVNYAAPTATGFPTPDVITAPPSGSAFPVGTTIVTATATNSVGTNICTFTVSVCAANIVVVNNNDSGAGSLRQAIADICPDGTITFDTNGVFATPQTIGLISGDLVIAKGLHIVGPGTNLLSISGNHTSRIFQINGAANPITNSISGLTLRDGNGSSAVGNTLGGAIYSFGAMLTLAHCTFGSNSAALYGGGLYGKLGSVTLRHCTFCSNTAYTGGGIFAVSNIVTLTQCALSGNSATGFDAYGGGIYTEFSSVELTDSAVSGNSAIGAGGVGFGSGGGICTVRGNLTLSNSSVARNVANLGGGGIYYSDNSDHSLTLTQCSITGNSAGDGGGISAFGGSATLTRCQVSGNSARYGGGIRGQALTLTESTVSGNSAVEEGGGIHSSFVALTQCTVSGNRATNSYGGGIFSYNLAILTQSTVSGNSSAQYGGGIYSYDAVLLTHCTVSGNSALSYGGGIYVSTVGALSNSIVAGNFAGTIPDDIYGNFWGMSGAYNLIGDAATSGTFTNGVNGNIVGNAGVGTLPITSILNTNLADNGGPTLTHALVSGSPAINAGAPAFTPPPDFDQRGAGFPRVLAGRLDIGAFEVPGIAPSMVCPSDVTVTNAYGQCCSIVAFAASASGLPEPTLTYALGGTNITSPYAFSVGPNLIVSTASNSFGVTQCVFTVTVLDPGPECLLVWKFDEASGLTALDSSGNANFGVLLKGPVRTAGVVGRALRFDGSDDHVNAINPTSLNVTGAFTVACWVKPESASDSRFIVIKGDSSDKKYAYGIRTSSGKIQYRWVSPSGSESVFQTKNKVISNGVWTHIAVAHTPGSAPIIFINGVVVPGSQSSGSATALIRPSSKPFSVGATSDERDEFKGTIDEVFVCLSALKAGQIQNLTNGLPPGPPPPPPAVGIATASPLPGGVAGTGYSASLVATGGTPGFTWSIVSGTLPAGLTLNPNTGAITGTPTVGTVSTFRARVIDSASQTAEKDFTMTIITPPPCVVHYKFDEASGTTALDTSGSGNHGTLINGPVRTNGMVGRALRFDGSNDRVNGSNTPSLNLTSALTLAAWIRPESVSGTRIVMIKGELDDEKYAWALGLADAKLQYRWVNSGGSESVYQSANNVLAAGRWTHVAVVHTPGSAPLLYTNGVLVASTRKSGSATATIGVSSKPFTVGSSSDGDDRFLGIMDEVFVCRGALSTTDLGDLMTGTPPGSSAPIAPAPATTAFSAPLVVEFGVTGEVATVAWLSVPGQTYRVQYKNHLDDTEWQDLTGDIYASGEVSRIEDFLDGQPQRFYRVVSQP